MSLDSRVREGLVRSSTAIEERDLDLLLGAIVRGTRRRRLVRRVIAVAVVLGIGLAAVLFGPRALDDLMRSGEPRPANPSGVPGIITTFAGTGVDESFGDGGPATEAGLNYPVDVAVDDDENVFILDHGGQRVRKVNPAGTITTVVGIPAGGDQPAAAAGEAGSLELSNATGIDVDADGNLYISPEQTTVLKIDPGGDVSTVAGTGTAGYSGDGGQATEANLNHIWDVAVDQDGDIFIASGSAVRKVDTQGEITTVLDDGTTVFGSDGGHTEAEIGRITGISADDLGNVFFIDIKKNRIGAITATGGITMVAGPGSHPTCIGPRGSFKDEGAPANELRLCGAEHLSVDEFGNIFVADTYNHRIVMIGSSGTVKTVAGTGTDSYSGDDRPADSAELSEPSGVTVGPDGFLYIADSGNHRVRRVSL